GSAGLRTGGGGAPPRAGARAGGDPGPRVALGRPALRARERRSRARQRAPGDRRLAARDGRRSGALIPALEALRSSGDSLPRFREPRARVGVSPFNGGIPMRSRVLRAGLAAGFLLAFGSCHHAGPRALSPAQAGGAHMPAVTLAMAEEDAKAEPYLSLTA